MHADLCVCFGHLFTVYIPFQGCTLSYAIGVALHPFFIMSNPPPSTSPLEQSPLFSQSPLSSQSPPFHNHLCPHNPYLSLPFTILPRCAKHDVTGIMQWPKYRAIIMTHCLWALEVPVGPAAASPPYGVWGGVVCTGWCMWVVVVLLCRLRVSGWLCRVVQGCVQGCVYRAST